MYLRGTEPRRGERAPSEGGGIRPSRAADAECADELNKLRAALTELLRGGLRRAAARLSNPPLIEYVHRVMLPAVGCPRVYLWLRARALQYVPPDVSVRRGREYIELLRSMLWDDVRQRRFFAGWEGLYAQLRRTELDALRQDFAYAALPVLPWP